MALLHLHPTPAAEMAFAAAPIAAQSSKQTAERTSVATSTVAGTDASGTSTGTSQGAPSTAPSNDASATARSESPAAPPPQQAAPRPARGELLVAFGVHGGATEWRTDPLGYGSFAFGIRLWRVFTPFVSASLGYARIDQRLLTRLALGVQGGIPIGERFFPRLYVGFVHQHEESLASVAQQPFGAVLGIGSGIRHRAGVHVGLGLDVTAHRSATSVLTLGPDLSFMYLTYSSGPNWFFTAGVQASGHFRLF